uniref:Probable U2 small nuclear ribonucleoprotein A' n=1 Tax=Corethrella appendiculata TaxID=1370023 RepID=U5EHD7_9DIPT
MVKLTPDLINQSFQCINPCNERELDLRGYKISQIENLGATLDQFDTVDFSDNDIRKLDGFPYLQRLKCLLFNNNRIVRISENLHESLPNLESVILTGNNIVELGDIDPLTNLTKLQTLSLINNNIATKQYYRDYIAFKFPNLRLLDFRKIKLKDREAANTFFKSKKGKEILKEIIRKSKANISATGSVPEKPKGADLQKIRDAIKKAGSLAEVERLTKLLQSGQLSNDSKSSNQMDTS